MPSHGGGAAAPGSGSHSSPPSASWAALRESLSAESVILCARRAERGPLGTEGQHVPRVRCGTPLVGISDDSFTPPPSPLPPPLSPARSRSARRPHRNRQLAYCARGALPVPRCRSDHHCSGNTPVPRQRDRHSCKCATQKTQMMAAARSLLSAVGSTRPVRHQIASMFQASRTRKGERERAAEGAIETRKPRLIGAPRARKRARAAGAVFSHGAIKSHARRTEPELRAADTKRRGAAPRGRATQRPPAPHPPPASVAAGSAKFPLVPFSRKETCARGLHDGRRRRAHCDGKQSTAE